MKGEETINGTRMRKGTRKEINKSVVAVVGEVNREREKEALKSGRIGSSASSSSTSSSRGKRRNNKSGGEVQGVECTNQTNNLLATKWK